MKTASPLGFTNDGLVTEATASHRSAEKEEREEQRRFQAAASGPEGPAAPSVLKAVSRIICPSIFSNTMKCGSLRGVSGSVMAEDTGGCLGECIFIRASRASLVSKIKHYYYLLVYLRKRRAAYDQHYIIA